MPRLVRRQFLLAAGALLAARRSAGQTTGRMPRIGYLLFGSRTEPPSRERRAFLDGLREFGRIPGRTIEIVYRSAEGEADFMPAVAQELVGLEPDLIAVSGTVAVLAAKRATRTIPIVMLAQGDPVGIGAVPSLAHPAGNVTGVSFLSSDLAPKRLQLSMECIPGLRRVAIISDRNNSNSQAEAHATLDTAETFGLVAESLPQGSSRELAKTLRRLANERPGLLYVTFEGGLAATNRTALAEFGLHHRVPVVSGWHFLTEAGGLLSYAPDIPAMFRRGAYYVDRVLKGAKPADLPIEQPTQVELVLNLRTATAIGVEFPRQLLLQADRIIR